MTYDQRVTCSPSLKEGASRFTPAGNPASPRRPCPGPRRHRRGRPGRLKKPYRGVFSQRRTKPAMRLCGMFAACGRPGFHPQSSSQGASAGSYARVCFSTSRLFQRRVVFARMPHKITHLITPWEDEVFPGLLPYSMQTIRCSYGVVIL